MWGIQTALRLARDTTVSSVAFWNSFISLVILRKYQFAYLNIQFIGIRVFEVEVEQNV